MYAYTPWKRHVNWRRNIASCRTHRATFSGSSEGAQYTHSPALCPSQARQLLALCYSPSQPLQIWNPTFWGCSAWMASVPSSSQVMQITTPAPLLAITGLFLQLQVSKFWFVNLDMHLTFKKFSCSWFKPTSQKCTLLYCSPEPFTLCDFENSCIDWRK